MNYDFTSEEEIKEYLQNIGTEYRFGCLSEKKPEVCHVFGEYLDLIKNDIEKASQIFKMNCDDYRHPRSCEAYGKYIIKEKVKEVPKYEAAFKYLSKSCDLNVGRGCYNAGVILSKGLHGKNGDKIDYKECIRLMDKACHLNSEHGCFYLSKLYIKGTPDGTVQKNMQNAFIYSVMACNLEHPKACLNLGLMYRKGEGTKKNLELSEHYRKKGERLSRVYQQG